MTKLTELTGKLMALETQLNKAKTEIVEEIRKLQEQIGDVELPADAEATIERLGALAQALDDLNPDAPTG